MSTLLLVAAIAVLLFAALTFVAAVVPLKIWRQKHHFYWGAIGVLVGCVLFSLGWHWAGAFVAAVSSYIALDDALGHHHELATGDRTYRSPLHRLFYRLFPSLAKY